MSGLDCLREKNGRIKQKKLWWSIWMEGDEYESLKEHIDKDNGNRILDKQRRNVLV